MSLHSGTCVQARQDNPELVCSQRAMGDFDPTQCTRQDDGSYNCFCVQPEDGTMLPDTVINVSDPDDAPAVCDGLGRFCKMLFMEVSAAK